MASASMERRAEAIFWRSPGRDPHRRVRRVAPAGGVMSVLARFSTSPLRSRDAAVRLRGVQKHPVEDTAPLAELARSDPDARVRREAVRRLEAPRVLLELVETAGDEDARKLARSRSEALLVKIAADSRDLEESRRALGLLEPLRAVADVVCRAHFEAVRTEAMERLVAPPARGGAEDVVGPRDLALAQVAARGGDPAMRGRALGAILTPAGLAQVAVSAGGRESASAAVRRIEDPDELLRVAESGAVRSVRRLARRLAEERLPPDHPERVRSRESDLLPRLERLESGEATATERSRLLSEVDAVLATGPVGEAASERVEAARARALRLEQEAQAAPRLRLPDAGADAAPDAPQAVVRPEPPVPEEVREILERLEDPESELSLGELDDLSRRAFLRLDDPPPRPAAKARLAAALRSSRDQAHDRRRRRVDAFDLAEMADHAAALHRELADPEGSGRSKRGRGDPVRARRELARLNRRFERLDLQDTPDGERFREAAAKAEALLVAAEAAREKRQRKTSERIAALDERLETLEKAESPSLPQIEGALRDLGALRADSEAWRAAGPAGQARFQRFQASLMPRLRESRELREWKRWSNLESQADIIRRGKALLEEEDAVRVDRGLVRLERSWRESRHADPDRGQELWEEWGQVRDALLERARPVREERDRAMAEPGRGAGGAGGPRRGAGRDARSRAAGGDARTHAGMEDALQGPPPREGRGALEAVPGGQQPVLRRALGSPGRKEEALRGARRQHPRAGGDHLPGEGAGGERRTGCGRRLGARADRRVEGCATGSPQGGGPALGGVFRRARRRARRRPATPVRGSGGPGQGRSRRGDRGARGAARPGCGTRGGPRCGAGGGRRRRLRRASQAGARRPALRFGSSNPDFPARPGRGGPRTGAGKGVRGRSRDVRRNPLRPGRARGRALVRWRSASTTWRRPTPASRPPRVERHRSPPISRPRSGPDGRRIGTPRRARPPGPPQSCSSGRGPPDRRSPRGRASCWPRWSVG